MKSLFSLALLLCAPLAAAAQEGSVSFEDLIVKMSEGGKRSFIYQENIVGKFGERQVHGGVAALDGPKAYETGLEILRTAGLAAVKLDSGAIRIVLSYEACKEALPVVSSVEGLPAEEEFYSLAIVLKHARVRDMLAPVQALIADPRNVVCAESTNSMIVSDYVSNLKKIADILKRMDAGPEATNWRLSVAVLEGSNDGVDSIPPGFEGVKLAAATGRKSFTLVGDGLTTLSMGGNPNERSPVGYAALRFWGGEKLSAEFRTSLSPEGALMLDQLKIGGDAEESKEAPPMLQTRLGVKDGAWAIAGTLPWNGRDGAVRVVLVKAELVK